MNIKVVIVWAFAVIVFAGIGLFGLVNQDLLIEDNPNDVYVPSDKNVTNSKTCNANLQNGISAYRFQMNANNQIEKVIITYTATTNNLDAYTSASNINNANVNGITTALSGGMDNFVLIVTIDIANYDRVGIENIRTDLNNLAMIIDSITDYSAYQSAVASAVANSTYVCD